MKLRLRVKGKRKTKKTGMLIKVGVDDMQVNELAANHKGE